MESKVIYFDNAATTKVSEDVLKEMIPYFSEEYGNPSSVHSFGSRSKEKLENARNEVSELLGVTSKEIFFTSGATEANNWAIRDGVYQNKHKGNHIITSTIEHHAVLHVFEALEKEGFDVTYLDVDEDGYISKEKFEGALRDDTIFASIMFANNEIGTILPIKELAEVANKRDILFHCDGVQGIGKVPINLRDLGVDMLSMSAHKFHGPKGVGALYVKKGVRISPLFLGGGQEKKKRPGTENLPGIIGMSAALRLAINNLEANMKYIGGLRDRLLEGILENVQYVKVNGSLESRLPGNLNVSFRFVEGESMLLTLDMHGFCASSGSACSSGSLDPSHVLLAIGLPHEIAHGSLRLSLSEYNTEDEVDYFVQVIPNIIKRLRDMSPLYEDFLKKGDK